MSGELLKEIEGIIEDIKRYHEWLQWYIDNHDWIAKVENNPKLKEAIREGEYD